MNYWGYGLAIVVLALLTVEFLLIRRVMQTVKAYAATEIEVMRHLRRTMEDLQGRDPQIAETVELGLAELARAEPVMAELARGNYVKAARLSRAR